MALTAQLSDLASFGIMLNSGRGQEANPLVLSILAMYGLPTAIALKIIAALLATLASYYSYRVMIVAVLVGLIGTVSNLYSLR